MKGKRGDKEWKKEEDVGVERLLPSLTEFRFQCVWYLRTIIPGVCDTQGSSWSQWQWLLFTAFPNVSSPTAPDRHLWPTPTHIHSRQIHFLLAYYCLQHQIAMRNTNLEKWDEYDCFHLLPVVSTLFVTVTPWFVVCLINGEVQGLCWWCLYRNDLFFKWKCMINSFLLFYLCLFQFS